MLVTKENIFYFCRENQTFIFYEKNNVLTLLCPLWLVAQAQKPVATPEKPNVIIVIADDLGYGDLSCYGEKTIHTPAVDALAKQGLRFTNAHTTAATCTPSRYSLLTGFITGDATIRV